MISNVVTSLRIVLLVPLFALILLGESSSAHWWALGTFVAAGLTDALDGYLARKLGEVSALGAMLDLIADRLLTAVTLSALIADGTLSGLGVIAGLVLLLRDLIVASLNEALPDRLDIQVSRLERVKITFHFVAVGLLIAPKFWQPFANVEQYELGTALLSAAALLAIFTLLDYCGRAIRAFAGR
jgi:CDP-diacylglycerol--glycerol-3-phosphate 3-phosphatidyltransferase/cardiolipin synthase